MRVMAFSDIHSVFDTWDAVYTHMMRQQPDAYWCVGDIVGRGYEPIMVAQSLKSLYMRQDATHRKAWVIGNHDHNVVYEQTIQIGDTILPSARMNPTDVALDADNRLSMQAGERADLLTWLGGLPVYGQDIIPKILEGVHVVHGRFTIDGAGIINEEDCIWEYCKTDDDVRAQIDHLHRYNHQLPRVVINGHTHYPMIALYDATTGKITRVKEEELSHTHTFDLTANKTLVINTGSVSFPKEIHPKHAIYAMLNFGANYCVEAQIYQICLPKDGLNIPQGYNARFAHELRGLGVCD